ncbi:uncharacterized G-patch domain protein DDB_G0278987 [Diabrotica virgifera virgifera]|uniref:Uncharacterized G-patch domain protein DDB_G0278987-like n=1 Tax=Diabrotica virgifera virgifera TaxID=50390 RepID=A0A6P7FEY0_DIAVI|nr:uncharacterized G-patch domain protein DDB_G0278987 [Diabrotica virgifera virgifera]XP_028134306.1 uncharacterized G-patch domain protein DDB_G0278987 [Diabrotica virgifera virgifera]
MPPQFLGNPFDQGDLGPDDDFDVDDDWISFNNEAGRELGLIITDLRQVNEDVEDYFGSNDEFEFEEQGYLDAETDTVDDDVETDSNPPVDDHIETDSDPVEGYSEESQSMSEDEYEYEHEYDYEDDNDDPDASCSSSLFTMSQDSCYEYMDEVLGDPEGSRSPSLYTMSEDDDCDVLTDFFNYAAERAAAEIVHTKEDSPKVAEESPKVAEDSPKVAESNSSIDSTDC